MKRTFFDNIIVVIIALLIGLFIILASYTTYATQGALVAEKQNNLINEATYLSEQTISSYIQGVTSLEYLQIRFNKFEDSIKTSVWYFAADGNLIAASNPDRLNNLPKNIKNLE